MCSFKIRACSTKKRFLTQKSRNEIELVKWVCTIAVKDIRFCTVLAGLMRFFARGSQWFVLGEHRFTLKFKEFG